MTENRHYRIHGLDLTLHPKAYMVEVKSASNEQEPEDAIWELPEWVFHPQITIWFSETAGADYQRALKGEQIKDRLMRERESNGKK